MDWKVIDEGYLNYLRGYESRIPFSNYGEDKYKPFFGALFDLNDEISYITQISHPQKRHYTLKGSKDFKKVYDKRNNQLLCVVNLNYMFPVPKKCMESLNYDRIEEHRSFSDETEKSKYIFLLKRELAALNKMGLEAAAESIYEEKRLYPESRLSQRCFDFAALDELCRLYGSPA